MNQHLQSTKRSPGELRTADRKSIAVLVIDDQEPSREICRQAVARLGFHSQAAESFAQALELLEREPVDIVLADIKTGDGAAGLLQEIKVRNSRADRKSTRLNSSHIQKSRMPSSA